MNIFKAQAVSDPRLLARKETERTYHPKFGAVGDAYVGGVPIVMSGSFVGFDRAAPMLGQHNAAVYGDLLGYPEEKIARLHRDGVI